MDIILFIPAFIIATILAFYIPGRVVLGNQKLISGMGLAVVSVILGIVLWGWQGYLFGFLHLRWLSYLYLLIFAMIFIKQRYFKLNIPKIQFKTVNIVTLLIAIVGIFGQTFQFVRNGEMTSLGLFLTNNNQPDHSFHAALVEELVRRFPPNEPGMYGIPLLNYHFWFHLVTADLIRVFHLQLFPTEFIGMTLIASVMLALIAYIFAKAIYDSKLFINLFLFFVFFSGDAVGWFLLLLKHQFSLNSGWLFEDGTNLMDAPGRGFAIIICFAALYLLYITKKQKSWRNIFIIGILFGSLIGFKIYVGIPFMLGLFVLALINGIKRDFFALWVFITASIFSLMQFLPFNLTSGGLSLVPFDIPREFFAQQVLKLSFLDMRWNIYFAHHNNFRLIEYGVLMSVGFLLIQFGLKFFGLIPLRKTIKIIGLNFFIFLYSTLFFSLVLGLLFFQNVGGSNIWEFFMTTSIILAIIASLNIALYIPKKNKIITGVLLLLFFVIVIPRWINSTARYFNADYQSGFHGIPNKELVAYDYIKNKTDKDSLIFLVGRENSVVYASIVNVLTERNLFHSGEGVSQQLTPEIKRRRNDINIIKKSIDNKKVNEILKKDKINYIFVYNELLLPIATVSSTLHEVFSDQSARIFKVN